MINPSNRIVRSEVGACRETLSKVSSTFFRMVQEKTLTRWSSFLKGSRFAEHGHPQFSQPIHLRLPQLLRYVLLMLSEKFLLLAPRPLYILITKAWGMPLSPIIINGLVSSKGASFEYG